MNESDQPPKGSNDLVVVVAVIVVVGLLAAVLLPKYLEYRAAAEQKRAHSQDIAVFSNLRQIQAGADQHFLENGVSSVAFATIVGTNSTQYVRSFAFVAQETYNTVIVQGQGISAMGVARARTVTFGP